MAPAKTRMRVRAGRSGRKRGARTIRLVVMIARRCALLLLGMLLGTNACSTTEHTPEEAEPDGSSVDPRGDASTPGVVDASIPDAVVPPDAFPPGVPSCELGPTDPRRAAPISRHWRTSPGGDEDWPFSLSPQHSTEPSVLTPHS